MWGTALAHTDLIKEHKKKNQFFCTWHFPGQAGKGKNAFDVSHCWNNERFLFPPTDGAKGQPQSGCLFYMLTGW